MLIHVVRQTVASKFTHDMYSLLTLGAIVLVLVYRILQIGKRDPRLPPGPPTQRIFGNALQIPPTGSYKM
jgi:hypothetical protein